jgi:voltage-gated potassium channel Kch
VGRRYRQPSGGGGVACPAGAILPPHDTGLAAASSILVTIFVGRAVFARGVVDAHRIAGAVAVYLNAALAFATTYMLLSDLSPTAFTGLGPDRSGRIEEMIHFTTVGYGDILPRSSAARSIADLEAFLGQSFPATLLARMVTLQISRR